MRISKCAVLGGVSALAIGAALGAVATPAFAQGSDPANVELPEVVVTARRVEERLQEVPLSISALDSSTLQANQIKQIQDLGSQVPNLITGKTSVPGAGQVAIRGVQGQSLPRPGLDNRVGVYLDGVYLARAQGQSFGLADIARIEVLKGPQGTLFGRNVTAGSINIVTEPPSGAFGGVVEAGVGKRDRQRFRATLNLPETNSLSARFTYLREKEDGDVKNLAGGTRVGPISVNVPAQAANPVLGTPASAAFARFYVPKPAAKTLGASKVESLFAALRFTGIEDLTADYKFDWTSQLESQTQGQIVGYSGAPGNGCVAAAISLGASTSQCGGAAGVISSPGAIVNHGGPDGYFVSSGAQSYVFGNGKSNVAYDEFTAPALIRTWGHNLTLNYDAPYRMTVRSITGYRQLHTMAQSGGDSGRFSLNNSFLTATNPTLYPASAYPAGGVTGFPLGLAFTEQKQHQFSEELQAFGPATDWLNYLVGAYYFRERTRYDQTVVNSNASSGAGVVAAVNGLSGVPPYAPNGGTTFYGLGALGAGDASDVISTSEALFGRLTIKPVQQIDVVLGGRYTRDHKRNELPQFMANFLDADPATAGQQPAQRVLSQTFKKFTYDATVTYHVTPDVNVYARYATAYLGGGALRNTPFLPETTISEEAGVKSEWFERRLRFNASAFWQKSKNYQFTSIVTGLPAPVNTATIVRNLGAATVKGFEAELTAVPMRGLTLNGSVGHSNQEYTSSATGVAPLRPPTPEWTYQLFAQYDTPAVWNEAYLSFRIDGNYRSRYYPSIGTPLTTSVGATGGTLPAELLALYGLPNSPQGRIDYARMVDRWAAAGGFWLANARVTLQNVEFGDRRGRISAYVRNIFNKEGKAFTANYGIAVESTWVPDRTYGVDLTLSF